MKITIINNKGTKRGTRARNMRKKMFPTFTIKKGTDVELGKRLVEMGFERKRNTKGAVFRVEGI